MTNGILFAEVFPVKLDRIKNVKVYELKSTNNQNLPTAGGKLSYRLRREFGSHWVWTSGYILTDVQNKTPEDLKELLKNLWIEDSKIYGCIEEIEQVDCRISEEAKADFFAKGLFEDLRPDILDLLKGESVTMESIKVKRTYEVRGWVIDRLPSISISISSNLIYKDDLKTYIDKTEKNGSSLPQNLWVADKTSTMKGRIVGISGELGKSRERLLKITQREEMKKIIEKSPDSEKIVTVLSGFNRYDYVASALNIIITTENLINFGVNPREFYRTSLLGLEKRIDIVKRISNIAKERNLIEDAYNSSSKANCFSTKETIGFNPVLRLRDREVGYSERTLFQHLSKFGLYRKSKESTIRIGVLLPPDPPEGKITTNFKQNLAQKASQLDFTIDVVKEVRLPTMERKGFEDTIRELQLAGIDLILAIFPDEMTDDEYDENNAYYNFKSLTINQGIPSQVVYKSTMEQNYATANIVLGIIGKTGSIPFVLADGQINYADLIVGIDIARRRKEKLVGSINTAATARVYLNNGEFLRYSIHDAQLEGETIPKKALQSLFPSKDFGNKRVIIHRDGYFRGDEKESLKKWGNEINAEFFLVEIIKTGTPRLYMTNGKEMLQPDKGTVFKISDTEAFLVSSLPPSPKVTPQPLRIRTELPFSVEQAAHSILCMTLLHYGSLRPPRLPVTIHYSDRIAYLALQGIKPKNLEGNIPFWL